MPKSEIHPKWYPEAKVICNGEVVMTTGSTQPEIHVDVWSGNHPFFTGTQKILDTEGRVDRFMRKYGMGSTEDAVDEKKAEKLAGDLNSIFDFIEKLNKLKTDNVEPLTSVAETTLKLRADEVKSKNLREQVIKNSPKENEDYFVVPKVIE